MIPFDYQPRTRIVFGPDKIDSLGELAGELGARRALLVTDPGIVAAGHAAAGWRPCARAGIETQLFDGVDENPTTEHVEAGVASPTAIEPELIVGPGGRQFDGLRQGNQLPANQRRPDAGLLGHRQGHAPDAPRRSPCRPRPAPAARRSRSP